jgi:hypothetical protein
MREALCPECGEYTPVKETHVLNKFSNFAAPTERAWEFQATYCVCGWHARGHLDGDQFVIEEAT